nr:hypothetical protein B0A51_07037 [Rachicladosporium sp. CCFEE 5018]
MRRIDDSERLQESPGSDYGSEDSVSDAQRASVSDRDRRLAELIDAYFRDEEPRFSIVDVKATKDTGSKYPCDSLDLERLQATTSLTIEPSPSPCSRRDVFLTWLQNLHKDTEANERLQQNFLSVRDTIGQTWDLPMKMFHDLDAALFHGQLRGRVILRWEAVNIYQNRKLGYAQHVLAAGDDPEYIKIALRFNMDWSCRPRHYMIDVLVHEMLHAYYIMRCGAGTDTPGGHGPLFVQSAMKLRSMTGLDVAGELRCANTFVLTHVQRNLPFIVDFIGGDAAVTRAEFQTLAFANRYQRQPNTEFYVPRDILPPDTDIGF